jgi:uncharacterized protein YndB with AHSA1/START domain
VATDKGERLGITARGEREVVMSRVFNAPRALVFDAWTRPELFARWFGPRGWTVPVCEIDLRPGGSYRYVLRRLSGEEMVMHGVYREVLPPERLVYTEAFEGFEEVGWRPQDETVITAILIERDGKTTWTSTILYPSQEVRDAALQLSQAWTGAADTMERLEGLLRTLAAADAAAAPT